MSDVLAQQVSIENAIKKTNVEGMDIIVRGQVPPNPSELLMTRGLGELIDWASQNYDMVLVDTPQFWLLLMLLLLATMQVLR